MAPVLRRRALDRIHLLDYLWQAFQIESYRDKVSILNYTLRSKFPKPDFQRESEFELGSTLGEECANLAKHSKLSLIEALLFGDREARKSPLEINQIPAK